MTPPRPTRAASGLVAIGLSALAILTATTSNASARPQLTASTVTTDSTSAAPTCGGETATDPSGASMTCAFDDEFSAVTGDPKSLDTSKWVPQLSSDSGYTTGVWPYLACYVNTPNNVSVSGGDLNLTVRKNATFTVCNDGGTSIPTQYTAGMVSTYGLFSQTYGRYEVRAKLPSSTAKGLQETLWLWPDDPKKYGARPASGEIDFAEFYSQYSNLDIPYIHYNYDSSTTDAATNTNVVTSTHCPINYGQFNDYAAVWEPGTITLQVNGTTCVVDNYVPDGGLSDPAPFDQPFIVALTSALGINSNAPTNATKLPATTQIDYVRVWK